MALSTIHETIWVVPKNRGTPKSSILIGFSIINLPFWGTFIFGNIHINHITHQQPGDEQTDEVNMPPARPMPKAMPKTGRGTNFPATGSATGTCHLSPWFLGNPCNLSNSFGFFHAFAAFFFSSRRFSHAESVLSFFSNPENVSRKLGSWEDGKKSNIHENRIPKCQKRRRQRLHAGKTWHILGDRLIPEQPPL